MWPVDEEEIDTVEERLKQYLEKAAREAKTYTSWVSPHPEYEKVLLDFAGMLAVRSVHFLYRRRESIPL